MSESAASSGNGVPQSQWTAVAILLRPQGRRGELLSEPLTDLPEVFQKGRPVYIDPAQPAFALEDAWHPTGKNAGRIVLKLSGCDTISAAEALAGKQLFIPSSALPALDDHTFFVGDLIGSALLNGNAHAGIITDVQFATGPDGRTRLEDAAPLLAVEITPGEDPVLVPFVRAWLVSVDIAAKRIRMNLPDGLLLESSPGDDDPGSPDNLRET